MAATLAREDREIYVLEQHETFGKEITSRSGASTHVAWFPPVPGDPLKYKLCARGRRKLWEVVDKYEIPYLKKAKLFAIIDEEDYGLLQEFLKRGLSQGAEARMLSKEDIKKIEPDLNYPAAIFIPETRKLDIIALLSCYALQAVERGPLGGVHRRELDHEKGRIEGGAQQRRRARHPVQRERADDRVHQAGHRPAAIRPAVRHRAGVSHRPVHRDADHRRPPGVLRRSGQPCFDLLIPLFFLWNNPSL